MGCSHEYDAFRASKNLFDVLIRTVLGTMEGLQYSISSVTSDRDVRPTSSQTKPPRQCVTKNTGRWFCHELTVCPLHSWIVEYYSAVFVSVIGKITQEIVGMIRDCVLRHNPPPVGNVRVITVRQYSRKLESCR